MSENCLLLWKSPPPTWRSFSEHLPFGSYLSFFSFRCSCCKSVTSFVDVPQALDNLLGFSVCSLCCLGFMVSTDRSPSSEVLSLVVSSLLISPSKAFFISIIKKYRKKVSPRSEIL